MVFGHAVLSCIRVRPPATPCRCLQYELFLVVWSYLLVVCVPFMRHAWLCIPYSIVNSFEQQETKMFLACWVSTAPMGSLISAEVQGSHAGAGEGQL